MDVWECDLVEVQGLSKYNDRIIFLLNVIDVFSKYVYDVPLKSNIGSSVTLGFESVLKIPKYSKRTCLGAEG